MAACVRDIAGHCIARWILHDDRQRLTVEEVIGSLNVAVAEMPRLAPVLWSAGVTELTVGGVLEFEGENTTSTQ